MSKTGNALSPRRQLISTTKAAEWLDVAPGTVRQMIADGKLRGYKVGRLIKVDANEVQALIDSFMVDNS